MNRRSLIIGLIAATFFPSFHSLPVAKHESRQFWQEPATVVVRRYVVNPSYVKLLGKFPPEALRPVTYNYQEIEIQGDVSAVLFKPFEPAKFIGTNGAKLKVEFQSINGATVKGFYIPGSFQIRSSDNNIIEENRFDSETSQPIRLRFGSDGNKIRFSHFERQNIPTTADVVAIYLSDGPNLNNEIAENTIINYSDGWQASFRDNTDYGFAAGSYIHHNRIGVTSKFHNIDGSMHPGLENAIDLKTGGTPENPMRIEYNYFFGYRPAILSGAGTPGYAINIKSCTSDVNLIGNVFDDCEAGIFLNAQYKPEGGWFVPRVNLIGNKFIGIKNHGFASQWPQKQGSVICGSNSATFQDNVVIGCERLEEMQPNAAAGPRQGIEQTEWVQ